MIPKGINFGVYWVVNSRGESPVEEYLFSIENDTEFLASAIDGLSKLRLSDNHGMPLTRPFKGKQNKGLFEARIKGGPNRQLARFPYVILEGRCLVLLFGFTKDSNETPPRYLSRARMMSKKLIAKEMEYEPADLPSTQ